MKIQGKSDGRQEPDWLISAPFNFNHPNVAKYSPEVTGRLILNSMCERLGWPSLTGKRLIDFGCGVRLAQTAVNLEIEIDHYAGVDNNSESIGWLKENVVNPRFSFHYLNMKNPMYNPTGSVPPPSALADMGLSDFDVACMFSVITHQAPEEAIRIFEMLRHSAKRIYFTAFIDDTLPEYTEKNESIPRLLSFYPTEQILDLVSKAGWRVEACYHPSHFQQTAFIAS